MRFTQKQMKRERRNAISRYRRWSVVKFTLTFLIGVTVGVAGYHYKDQFPTVVQNVFQK